MVKRRKFLVGLGALAAGSGAALGTGAYTSNEMNRDSNIPVTNDNTALLALRPHQDSSVIRQRPDGELAIDMTQPGGQGLNVDSKYYFGDPKANSPDPAFTITNQDNIDHDITVGYTTTRSSVAFANMRVFVWKSTQTNVTNSDSFLISQGSKEIEIEDVGPGESVYVAFWVQPKDKSSAGGGSDLSGQFNVSAEES